MALGAGAWALESGAYAFKYQPHHFLPGRHGPNITFLSLISSLYKMKTVMGHFKREYYNCQMRSYIFLKSAVWVFSMTLENCYVVISMKWWSLCWFRKGGWWDVGPQGVGEFVKGKDHSLVFFFFFFFFNRKVFGEQKKKSWTEWRVGYPIFPVHKACSDSGAYTPPAALPPAILGGQEAWPQANFSELSSCPLQPWGVEQA